MALEAKVIGVESWHALGLKTSIIGDEESPLLSTSQ